MSREPFPGVTTMPSPAIVTVTVAVVVSEKWIELCTKGSDLFSYNYCGYWAEGVERSDDTGWLVWEAGVDSEPQHAEAIAAWKKGDALPRNYHRLDREAAIRAFQIGAERWGAKWYENGDADSYDYALQMALLGKAVYG